MNHPESSHIATARETLANLRRGRYQSAARLNALDRCIADAERWRRLPTDESIGAYVHKIKYFDKDGKEITP